MHCNSIPQKLGSERESLVLSLSFSLLVVNFKCQSVETARDPLDFLVGRRGREPRKSVELIREMRSYASACDVAKGSRN
uniref:Uncharacterized protein n=1 Tax=Trichogramma kaykai TaxID=54128 RepID=A0ABD2WS74_9HYME